MKKYFLILMVVMMIFIQVCAGYTNVCAVTNYSGASSGAVTDLNKASSYGLITDKVKNNMKASITREEIAETAVRLYEKSTGKKVSYSKSSPFSDTSNAEILKAYKLGIMSQTNSSKKLFSPKLAVSREQAALIFYLTAKAINPKGDFSIKGAGTYTDEKNISPNALTAVKYLAKSGFLKGTGGKFNPKLPCTRETAVITSMKIYEKFASNQGSSSNNTSDAWGKMVINDFEIEKSDVIIKEKGGYSYIFVPLDKCKSAFKYVGLVNPYPYESDDNGNINFQWKENEKVLLDATLKVDSTSIIVNGQSADIGMGPFSQNNITYIPINAFIEIFSMKLTVDDNCLFVEYKDSFPLKTLEGKWSDIGGNLFTGVEDLTTGLVSLPSFAQAYIFNSDGTFISRIIGTNTLNGDGFVEERGKYKIIGYTIMFYDRTETYYKGKPLMLVHKNKPMPNPSYYFIYNYDKENDKISIGGFWLTKIK